MSRNKNILEFITQFFKFSDIMFKIFLHYLDPLSNKVDFEDRERMDSYGGICYYWRCEAFSHTSFILSLPG